MASKRKVQQHINDIQSRLSRQAIVASLSKARGLTDLASQFGFVVALKSDAAWPSFDGEPMVGLLQINTAELPSIPSALTGVALLRVWVSLVDDAILDPDGVVIRSSPSLSDETPVAQPVIATPIKRCGIAWANATDMPGYQDLPRTVSDEIANFYAEVDCPTISATKIGGFARRMQGPTAFDVTGYPSPDSPELFDYVLQIGSEKVAEWTWGDDGIGYVGRSRTNPAKWKLDWQSS